MRRDLGEMSFLKLRKMIGIIGILLPIIGFLGNYWYCETAQSSISATYYTITGDFFVGALFAIGSFFWCDEGYDIKDSIANKLAGICCVLIALNACEDNTTACALRHHLNLPWRIDIHYACATILFTDLGIISLFLFTLSSGNMTEQKKSRNKIYRVCGVIILLSVLTIPFLLHFKQPIYFPETISLFSFGYSWMVKGEVFYKDK